MFLNENSVWFKKKTDTFYIDTVLFYNSSTVLRLKSRFHLSATLKISKNLPYIILIYKYIPSIYVFVLIRIRDEPHAGITSTHPLIRVRSRKNIFKQTQHAYIIIIIIMIIIIIILVFVRRTSSFIKRHEEIKRLPCT